MTRYYRNGTVVKLSPNGYEVGVIVPPKSLAPMPTDFIIFESDDGTKYINFTNGTLITYYPPASFNSSKFDNATACLFSIFRPESSENITYFYANGSVAVIQNYSTVYWIVQPKSYFVDYNETIFDDGSRLVMFANYTGIYDYPPVPFDAPEAEKALATKRSI